MTILSQIVWDLLYILYITHNRVPGAMKWIYCAPMTFNDCKSLLFSEKIRQKGNKTFNTLKATLLLIALTVQILN